MRAWLESGDAGGLVSTPLALAEMDYLLSSSRPATRALRDDLLRGAYEVRWWPGALTRTLAVADANPGLGMTDASLVALAAHLETIEIATLDERHFRPLAPLGGQQAFRLLPADA